MAERFILKNQSGTIYFAIIKINNSLVAAKHRIKNIMNRKPKI